MIAAGRLDQRITLQTSAINRDSLGGATETWVDTATVSARVSPLSGRRMAQAQQVGSAVSKQVEIRWRAGITAAMRIRFADGRVAKVSWFEEHKREGWLIMVCEDIDA
jgi:SPP1 family predicted phage head-tail adaptor